MKTTCIPVLLGFLLIGSSPGKTIPNHAIADLVLGQSDFVTSTSGSPVSSFSMSSPIGIAIDPLTRKVFVADSDNNRVLRYSSASSLSIGAGAEAVFGQPSFSSSGSALSQQGMSRPAGLFFDRRGRLWVADTNNNRVLMFEAASYRSSHPHAEKVVGQPDFSTGSSGTTASKLDDPYGVCVDSQDRLWVSDDDNNRVLRFESISAKPIQNASADGVLGQANFTTSAQGSGSSGLQGPIGISISSAGTLFVACNSTNRVMVFNNAAALGNGAGANFVLGQPDFSTTTSGLSATQFNTPEGVTVTADNSLWVSDYSNRRLLRFDNVTTLGNGAAASGVLGQPNFTTANTATTSRECGAVFHQTFADPGGDLWSACYSQNRVLRFPPDVTKPLLAVTTKVPKSTTKKKLQVSGTASDTFGIVRVQFRIGSGPLKTATGTTSWKFTANLKPGKNKITVVATDSVGNQSASKTLRIERE